MSDLLKLAEDYKRACDESESPETLEVAINRWVAATTPDDILLLLRQHARYMSHTLSCMAAMTSELVAAKSEDEKAAGIRPGPKWFLNQVCICGLRDLIGGYEQYIGEADDT